eukprot:TRINITY_DN779965_c0_g1_i1.p1 TRINITY_DN779965_c0_g1~~TRINITY_DN779965_c0_g1_i1.p1  ORF type:complete len:174 (+),score=37.95 TRINITY_DN779965_c0_g1_i1:228-749(+)
MLASNIRGIFRVFSKRAQLAVLYGSQGGTAEGIATQMWEKASDKGVDVKIGELDDWEDFISKDSMNSSFLAVICSNYGLADPPENALLFFEYFVREQRKSDELKGLEYSVFGLGNSIGFADFYQGATIAIDKALAESGADRTVEMGQGCAGKKTIQEEFEKWSDLVFDRIQVT